MRLHVLAEIACRYGVRPLDKKAVLAFFEGIGSLDASVRSEIMAELRRRENEVRNAVDDILEAQVDAVVVEEAIPLCRN